jgi:hypothetical protein
VNIIMLQGIPAMTTFVVMMMMGAGQCSSPIPLWSSLALLKCTVSPQPAKNC